MLGCGSEHDPELDIHLIHSGGNALVVCREAYCHVSLSYAGPSRTYVAVAGDTEDRRNVSKQVEISGLRNVRVELGDGNNGFLAFQLAFAGIENLTIVAGAGDDDLRLSSTTVSDRLTIATGSGADTIVLFAAYGNEATDVDTGPGADTLEVNGWGPGPNRLATGDGDDTVTLYGSSLSGPLLLDTAGGDDLVTAEIYPELFSGAATLRLVGGPGFDRLDLTIPGPIDAPDFERVTRTVPSGSAPGR